MDGNNYPLEDQVITVIAVKNGTPHVNTAQAMIVKPHRVVVKISPPPSDDDGPERGQIVTLLYDRGGDRVLRLKTVVSDVIDGCKWLLQPTAEVSEGERREFLRATVSVKLDADAVSDSFELIDDAVDSSGWSEQRVDLSGSGVSFNWEGRCKKGDRMHVQMSFQDEQTASVRAVGDVVRAKAQKNGSGMNVAVHFTEVAEGDRDALINYVFRHYYEKMNFKVLS